MNIEAFLIPPATAAMQWQFIVGCLLGAGVGITLSRSGIVLTNPETRWQFVSIVMGFAGVFGLVCGLLKG
ncbi:MAG: hypothetical protein DPW12_10490 [Rhodocyclaceae bacterium]|nr:hypothetical protein [Candidatus Hydrogenedentota bacterium]MCG3167999.1 hypothetical protein [Bacteroidia bacterium]MCQ3924606.1 hypothetical protein [Rhodocyclaceae bacterium]